MIILKLTFDVGIALVHTGYVVTEQEDCPITDGQHLPRELYLLIQVSNVLKVGKDQLGRVIYLTNVGDLELCYYPTKFQDPAASWTTMRGDWWCAAQLRHLLGINSEFILHPDWFSKLISEKSCKKIIPLYTSNRHLKLNTATLLLEDEHQQIPLLEKYSTLTSKGREYSLPEFSGFSRVTISIVNGEYDAPTKPSLTEKELNEAWFDFTGILFRELCETAGAQFIHNSVLLSDAVKIFKIKFAPLVPLAKWIQCRSGDKLFSIELQIEKINILIVLELL